MGASVHEREYVRACVHECVCLHACVSAQKEKNFQKLTAIGIASFRKQSMQASCQNPTTHSPHASGACRLMLILGTRRRIYFRSLEIVICRACLLWHFLGVRTTAHCCVYLFEMFDVLDFLELQLMPLRIGGQAGPVLCVSSKCWLDPTPPPSPVKPGRLFFSLLAPLSLSLSVCVCLCVCVCVLFCWLARTQNSCRYLALFGAWGAELLGGWVQ